MIRNMEFGNLKIIETGKFYGNMTISKKYYPSRYSDERIKKEFFSSRINLGNSYGFDGRKIYSSLQLDKNGSWYEIDENFVQNYPNGTKDIKEDILIVSSNLPGVAIGYSTYDYPVIIAYDKKKKVVAASHCKEAEIENKLPIKLIDALIESHASSVEDIETYISVCAGSNLKYNELPYFTLNNLEFWSKYIFKDSKGYYRINIKKAIENQFESKQITNISSPIVDTIHDPNFYSLTCANQGNMNKMGCNFSGAFFKSSENKIMIK